MASANGWFRTLLIGAFLGAILGSFFGSAAGAGSAEAAAPERPVVGKTVHFPDGTWSGLPETGPDKKVRQCVLVAKRARGAAGEGIDTALSLTIGRGSELAIAIGDDKLPSEAILDDQAKIVIGDHAFPATAFTVRSVRWRSIPPTQRACCRPWTRPRRCGCTRMAPASRAAP